ncbi:MAG: oxidoreductase [Mycobacteriales bacterium]
MGLFKRKRAGTTREAVNDDVRHLEQFAQSRRGVEGFVEPRTTVTTTTMALVAHDGEWTRRRIEDERAAADFGRRMTIPVYDVQIVGYPQRMRDWTRRQNKARRDGVAAPSLEPEPPVELPPLE